MPHRSLQHRLKDYEVLVLAGYRNSGPLHWQSRWESLYPEFKRVQQNSWVQPKRHEWISALDHAVHHAEKPVILIAHSLGVITAAHWAAKCDSSKVAGALLVAPADVERTTVSNALKGFAPMPRAELPFPSHLIGSSNDPCCSAWRAAELAEAWGADFTVLESAGHINAGSNLGDWEQGLGFLEHVLGKAECHASEPYHRVVNGYAWVA